MRFSVYGKAFLGFPFDVSEQRGGTYAFDGG